MIRIVQRISDRALRMFLPQREAGACVCTPEDSHYEYRCQSVGWQRRYCNYSCTCSKSCSPWVTIVHNMCP